MHGLKQCRSAKAARHGRVVCSWLRSPLENERSDLSPHLHWVGVFLSLVVGVIGALYWCVYVLLRFEQAPIARIYYASCACVYFWKSENTSREMR